MACGIALLLAALLCAAGFAAYEAAEQPSNEIFGSTVVAGPPTRHAVALTFDDGPNPPYTNAILRVLEREHVHATFFVVGRAVQAYPGLIRREVRDGDAVGNHSWDHAHLIVLSQPALRRSLERTDDAVYAAARVRTTLMRPPFGARDWSVMKTVREMGYTVVMWSVPLARDWEYPAPRVIARRVLSRVSDGAIIVLHDGNQGRICGRGGWNAHVCDRAQDIEATRIIVQTLKREGYRFLTVPQLMRTSALAAR